MMLLRPSQRLDDAIIELLGTCTGADATYLHRSLCQRVRPCTLQGVYHELRKLQRLGVVLKIKGNYHLSISWASELMHFADQVYDHCIGSATAASVLPAEEGVRAWQFRNLLKLDDFWMHIMQILYTETRSPALFAWNPYPWFYFAQPEKVEQYYGFVKRERRKFYYILGADTYLSRRYAEGVDSSIFEYSFAAPPFAVKESTHVTCVAPYLVRVTLDADTTEAIRLLFSSIESDADLNFIKISSVLNRQARVRIQVERHEKKHFE